MRNEGVDVQLAAINNEFLITLYIGNQMDLTHPCTGFSEITMDAELFEIFIQREERQTQLLN